MRRNATVAMLCASFLLLGLYVGRFSVTHKWADIACTGLYCFNAILWAVALRRDAKAAQDELRFRKHLHLLDQRSRPHG